MRAPPRPAATALLVAAAAAAAAQRADHACPEASTHEVLVPLRPSADLFELAAGSDALEPRASLALLQVGGEKRYLVGSVLSALPPTNASARVPALVWWGRSFLGPGLSALPTINGSARVLEVIQGGKPLFGLEGLAFGEVSLMRSAPLQDWVILAAACAAFFALDWAVLQRLPHTFGWDLALLGFWVVVGIAFNTLVWIRFGPKEAGDWAMGFVIEWMLSLDNLMLIQMVFVILRTPPIQIRKAVSICMFCSVFTCMGLYVLVAEMFSHFRWIRYLLAASLIWGGIQAAISSDDIAPEDLCVIQGLKWLLGERLSGSYSADGSVFTRDAPRGKAQATLLLVAIVMAGWIDTIFSLDSVAIKVSIIENGYVAYSSSVLAIFVLRAMFFVIASLVQMFDLLRYGLCIILIFVGVQMIVTPWIKITPVSMFIVMVVVFMVSIVASVIKNQGKAPDSGQPQEAPQEVPDNGQAQDEPGSGQPQEAY